MNTDRIQPRFTDAVVTYSRIPSRGSAARDRRGALATVERLEPRLDAAEIPLIDPHDEVDPAFAVPQPELRADVVDVAFADKGRRTGSMRVVVLGAGFAILAGAGVLAASIGVATIIPGGSPSGSEPVSETALRLTSGEPVSDAAPLPSAVREIPIAVGEEAPAAEAVAIVAPPLPRPRPEVKTASFEPEPPAADGAPPPVLAPPPEVASTPDPKPAAGEKIAPAPKAMASSAPAAEPAPQSEDALITDIEETLAKIDKAPAGVAPAAAPAAVAAVSPAILPPPPLEPTTTVLPPSYPQTAEGCPPSESGFGPCYDVMPPEPLTNGYYAPGPVPPEPVPYPYPPASSDRDSFSSDSGGSAESADSSESETHRSGPVRRAISRTADAVSRVFSRDR